SLALPSAARGRRGRNGGSGHCIVVGDPSRLSCAGSASGQGGAYGSVETAGSVGGATEDGSRTQSRFPRRGYAVRSGVGRDGGDSAGVGESAGHVARGTSRRAPARDAVSHRIAVPRAALRQTVGRGRTTTPHDRR